MNVSESALVALNALAAAALMVAGTTKVVVPQPVRRALHELAPGREIPLSAVRAFAGAEVLVALALLLPSTRVAAGVALAALGAVFAVAGAAGRARRSAVPCGCLGGGDAALGLRNVLAGAAFLGVAGVNLTTASSAVSSAGDPWNVAPLGAAAATLLLCLWIHRLLMWRLFGPRPAAPSN